MTCWDFFFRGRPIRPFCFQRGSTVTPWTRQAGWTGPKTAWQVLNIASAVVLRAIHAVRRDDCMRTATEKHAAFA
jgi:hypothetical protein